MHPLIVQDHPVQQAPELPVSTSSSALAPASEAQAQYLASDFAERDLAYWRDKLDTIAAEAGGEAFNEFATDYRRPLHPSEQLVAPCVARLDANVVAALTRLAQAQRAGLHALLLTLLAAEIRRRDIRSNLIIGTDVTMRQQWTDLTVDHLTNVLPIILTGGNPSSLADRIRTTQDLLNEATAHGGYPGSLLYREFCQRHPDARPNWRTSLFDISLTETSSLACADANRNSAHSTERLLYEKVRSVAGIDLAFSFAPIDGDGGGLELVLVRDPDVYRASTAQAWLRSFASWARWLAEDISRAAATLPALLPEEVQCLEQWERGPTRLRPAQRMHEIFESIVDRYPQRAAVVTATGVQTFAEVEAKANRIAWTLLDCGVVHEQAVAVLTECSADLAAAILGIWKAGAVYLPLTLELPTRRLVHMVADSGAKALIVLDGEPVPPALAKVFGTILRPEVSDENALRPPIERPQIAGAATDLAYIIYTSGTTGTPKGLLLQHDGPINVVFGADETIGFTPDDRISLVASPGFDASIWELGMCLLLGIPLVPVSRALRDDPWALKEFYTAQKVTIAFHAPSYLRVSEERPFEGLRVLLCGGEAPNHADVRIHAEATEFWNCYGPTETTIIVAAERLSQHLDVTRPLSVGGPLPNTRMSIRRDNGEPLPPGVAGEVWLGGTGLARGYLNSPDLTALRFVETSDGRFYRSGDWGRWTDDGRLELAGRVDDQIKLHGQRAELGEIEQALRSHASVEAAVTLVDVVAADRKVLRAFVRLNPAATIPSQEQWREHLRELVPLFMVPTSVTAVAAFPLTTAGKIDRDTLLLTPRERECDHSTSLPSGDLETRIAALWGELFGRGVSRSDNFFALGGNSLLAVTLAHRLSFELAQPIPARELFAAPTLAGFAQRVLSLQHTPAIGRNLQMVPESSDVATEGQREFLVAEQAGLDTRTFTIPLLRRVEGEKPSLYQWNTAWAALVARHAALRTYFVEDEAGCLHRVEARLRSPDLNVMEQPDSASAQAFIRKRQAQPFVMGTPPLWRAGLVDVANSGEQLFWLALHHSVGDGQSVGIIVEELSALLRGESLPALSSGFGESAAREQAYLSSPVCAEDASYWRQLLTLQLDSAFDEASLDFPRSAATKPGNHRFEARLSVATTRSLEALARQHEASLHAVMLTLLALEAGRRSRRRDIIVGTAASLRETAAEMRIVGDFVGMLPVPCHLPQHVAFGAALRETQQALLAGMQHARYPFARIYHDFWSDRPELRHPARYPIFDLAVIENPNSPPVMASVRLARVSELAQAGEGSVAYELSEISPGLDMVLTHEQLADSGLLLQWHVNAALFTKETARRWFDALRGWATWLADEPERAQQPLPGLLPDEAALINTWEQGARVDRPALRFHELFERILDAHGAEQGTRVAIVTQVAIITYDALEREANAIAHALLMRGTTQGTVVGVLTERSAKLVAAVLGIWKSGATYLPLAADLPEERLLFMARDAEVSQLIALDALTVPPELTRTLAPVLRPEELDHAFRLAHSHRPRTPGGFEDAAYLIYTSGSTGQPKGIVVSHSAYVNTVLGVGEELGLSRDDRCLMFASPSFDVSLSDMGMPLAFGAALCPVSFEVLSSPNRFLALLSELAVTVADVTPTYLRLFDGATLPSLRILVTGGEAPFPVDVQTYASRLLYVDAYGPSENAITSTMRRLCPDNVGAVCGARPLPNTSVQICDSEGNQLPPGALGEVWLGGAGLARCYIGRPDLTAAAFVETAQGRRYRSGDLGSWRASGELDIRGRVDDQVKLNGVRIELGEIECAVASHSAIAQAVALLDGGAGPSKSLYAFVRLLPGQPAPSEETWRNYLSERLPPYMIPSSVLAVAEIPLSSSGKVNRAALRALLTNAQLKEVQPPQAGLEAQIASIWEELLSRGPIGRDDNFFALGGHSLLAIATAHRLEAQVGHPVPARELFAAPTLRAFAHRISQLGMASLAPMVSSNRATEGQREFWVAEHAGLDTRGFNIPLMLQVIGRIPADAQWRSAWTTLTKRHDALRTSFHDASDGELVRTALPELVVDWETCTQLSLSDAVCHVRSRQMEPFVMERPPLVRAGLVNVANTHQPIFWLALHHSLGDGVSLGVLLEEMQCLLRGDTLPPLAGHFDHVAGREKAYLGSSACEQDALFWLELLNSLGNGASGTAQPFDEWPLDFSRPRARTTQNARGAHTLRVHLNVSVANGLRRLAQSNGASLHALILTIMATEVWRRTERPEFVLGSASSTRDADSEQRIVGYCVNTLPIPCRVGGPGPIEPHLQAMQRTFAEVLQHGRYPFARIYRDYRRMHGNLQHPARFPLFDLVVTENPHFASTQSKPADPEGELNFAAVAAVTSSDDSIRYELRLSALLQDMVLIHEQQEDGGLVLQLSVNAAIYERETAEAWFDSIVGWARYLAEVNRVEGVRLPALLPQEEALLAGWSQGATLQLPASSLPAQFEYWARNEPERAALVTEHGVQTYVALDARANALAHALRARGLAPHEPVGVMTDRSIALPETALAIWKAGGCYLPLIKDLPADRLAFIARDAKIRILVVIDGHDPPSSLVEAGCEILRPENLSEAFISNHCHPLPTEGYGVGGSDLAYIIYTSGSTGVPKGVMLHHQGLLNLGLGTAAALGICSSDRALLMASPAFDAWIAELAMTWTVGAALVPILRNEMDEIAHMRGKLERLRVSVAMMPPAYLRLFEQADFPSLRVLMTVGESPHRADALHYATRLRYVNGYGPTENTAAASYGQVDAKAHRVTAGKPLTNTSIHILNSRGDPVPPNAIGLIWLGGMGLALGYLNRPELTAESFVESPLGRLYCTGDLGRWNCSGDLEILGRSDGQVKLRGQRVELGEIEHQLSTHPDVHQAVAAVQLNANGTQTLWAFVCLRIGATEPVQQTWRDYLSRTLPSYMLPSSVLSVAAIPVSTAGKVDRTALLRVVSPHATDSLELKAGMVQRTPPRDDRERRIARVWAEHLQCPFVAREDNFFDLGGDSVRVIAVVSQLRRMFHCAINDLYEHPHLSDFATLCQQRPEHLLTSLRAASRHWQEYQHGLVDYEKELEAALRPAQREYALQNSTYELLDLRKQREYARVLLTGATGYVGSYLLRELLTDRNRHIDVLVRGSDDRAARARLGETLCHYFGKEVGIAMRDNPRLSVLAGDLRRDDLGITSRSYERLANGTHAVFHCAANVKHFGHYWELHADNVAATAAMLKLAAHSATNPADFHFVSTLSTCGNAPEEVFRLFTEYDSVPEQLDDNYYIRSKQEAERLVIAARSVLSNACVHRIGNVVFAAEGGPLQVNIKENAFFRQLAAYLRLGVVPDDSHVWLCHVDVVARGLLRLASAAALNNETHHLEHQRRDTLADFASTADAVRFGGFDLVLQRLETAVDEPEMDAVLTETMENLKLYSGRSPQSRARRQEIVSDRTQTLLARLGVAWPDLPEAGRAALLRHAAKHFASPQSFFLVEEAQH